MFSGPHFYYYHGFHYLILNILKEKKICEKLKKATDSCNRKVFLSRNFPLDGPFVYKGIMCLILNRIHLRHIKCSSTLLSSAPRILTLIKSKYIKDVFVRTSGPAKLKLPALPLFAKGGL